MEALIHDSKNYSVDVGKNNFWRWAPLKTFIGNQGGAGVKTQIFMVTTSFYGS